MLATVLPAQEPHPPRRPPGLPTEDAPSAWIARERTEPGWPEPAFLAAALALAGAVAGLLIWLASRVDAPRPSEQAFLDAGAPISMILGGVGLGTARIVSALAAGGAVLATALAARRLAHSQLAGLGAAALLALDPAFLVEGRLALAHPLLVLAAAASLWLAVVGLPVLGWLMPIPLVAGVLVDPLFAFWGLPLAAMMLLRGHIYGAPKHLGTVLLQTLAIPGAVALVMRLARLAPAPGCTAGVLDVLLLRTLPRYDSGTVAVHNPILWLGGAALVLGLGIAALVHTGTRFRLARIPGRIQLRLPQRLPALWGRSLWLLLLVAAAPFAVMWGPLFATAQAMGARHLGRDSAMFGVMVLAALVLFAAVYLVRLWSFVAGDAGPDDLNRLADMLPWGRVQPCFS